MTDSPDTPDTPESPGSPASPGSSDSPDSTDTPEPPEPPAPDSLDQARLAQELPSFSGPWTAIEVVRQTGSTNADLLEWAGRGLAEGAVLIAEEQTAGRGRLGRSWVSQPGAALTFSMLLRPDRIPPDQRGWLPLITGIGTATAVRMLTGLDACLKWPNDVVIDGRKLAGILAEWAGSAIVIGVGLNVSGAPEDLPAGPGGLPPTSLLAEGTPVQRDVLLIEILRAIGQWYKTFSASPDAETTGLHAQYERMSATVGREVRVELPGGQSLAGVAAGIDAGGQLLVEADGVSHPVAAGDVIHLR